MDNFFIYNDTYKKLTFFSMLDVIMMLIWLILVFGVAFYRKSRHSELEYYKYYLPNLSFKIAFALVYSLYYILVVGGGDSIAYWDLSGCMNNLFWESPQYYFNNLFYDYDDPGFIDKYTIVTGYPPAWIMREHQGFFIGKIVSLFSFFTGNSYLVITFLFATITANVSWRFYRLVNTIFPDHHRFLAWSALFIPSVSFWCTGISKDTFVMISILIIVTHGFNLIRNSARSVAWSVVVILFHIWMLYHLRSVVLMALVIPFFIAASTRFSRKHGEYAYFKIILQVLIILISMTVFFFVIRSYGQEMSLDKYIKEAEVVQKDFSNNQAYTGKKYTLEITDYTPLGMLRVLPEAIFAGIYRPLPWEALTPTLLLNGMESAMFLYLTFRFFRRGAAQKLKVIRANEFLLFCFFFVIIFGFVTGFSSIIFGVLVRLRAPLLPFLGILLTAVEKKAEDSKQITTP